VIARLPDGEACMIRQGYLPWLRAGERVAAYEHAHGYFAEHSTPERYLASNWALLHESARLRHPPGRLTGIDPTARIHPTATIVEPVRIGAGAVIGANVTVGPDAIVGDVDRGWPRLERALQRANGLLAAECVGGSQKVLDMSVAYARERIQFGRPIGSFQAVKHKCADMLVDVELGRSAMYYAAWAASEEEAELALAASMAKAFCGEAYTRVASNGIHVHGGIGFTWEHDMHLYFKRAKSNEMLLGDPSYHRDLVAKLVPA